MKVFDAQRFRFLGALYEDGSFGLVSALDVKPLDLRIAGIPVRVPLKASGRLRLSGRARRDRVRATVEAEGNGACALQQALARNPHRAAPRARMVPWTAWVTVSRSTMIQAWQGS